MSLVDHWAYGFSGTVALVTSSDVNRIGSPFDDKAVGEFINEIQPQGRLVGMYTQRERADKIRKYKQKLMRWRHEHGNDTFNGRSRVAKKKLRYFGRFIKYEDFKDKLLTDDQIIQNNIEMDKFAIEGDYNKLVDIITQNPSEIK